MMRKYTGSEAYVKCCLCPRQCHVNRMQGEKGFCRETAQIRAARAALHFWEEPCISGKSGSGAVFFTGCSMRCVYCQNYLISGSMAGKTISEERLSEIFLELQDKGANNINLVTAGHFIPGVIHALYQAKNQGLSIPVVYNTSGYESIHTIRALNGLVDIYLPDFKYADADLASRYSAAEDYTQIASQALKEMVSQTGKPVFYIKEDPEHDSLSAEEYNACCDQLPEHEILMKKGTVVRHLLLPGCVQNSKKIIRYLYETYHNDIYISIMNQFTPVRYVEKYPVLNRKVTHREYEKVIDYAISLGVENAFIQDGITAEESFIPDFSFEGL